MFFSGTALLSQLSQKRIRNLGGFVSPNGRVVGMLAVSRAFGDLDLQPFVSAYPFVNVVDIANRPDFLVVACDGIPPSSPLFVYFLHSLALAQVCGT